jgi:hypothetical protein
LLRDVFKLLFLKENPNGSLSTTALFILLLRFFHRFTSYDGGGEGAAATYGLIGTAPPYAVAPEAWLRHVQVRIAGHPVNRAHDFLPWNQADQPAVT